MGISPVAMVSERQLPARIIVRSELSGGVDTSRASSHVPDDPRSERREPKGHAEVAGHARMATTLEIYNHVNMDAKRGVDEGGIRRVLM